MKRRLQLLMDNEPDPVETATNFEVFTYESSPVATRTESNDIMNLPVLTVNGERVGVITEWSQSTSREVRRVDTGTGEIELVPGAADTSISIRVEEIRIHGENLAEALRQTMERHLQEVDPDLAELMAEAVQVNVDTIIQSDRHAAVYSYQAVPPRRIQQMSMGARVESPRRCPICDNTEETHTHTEEDDEDAPDP